MVGNVPTHHHPALIQIQNPNPKSTPALTVKTWANPMNPTGYKKFCEYAKKFTCSCRSGLPYMTTSLG